MFGLCPWTLKVISKPLECPASWNCLPGSSESPQQCDLEGRGFLSVVSAQPPRGLEVEVSLVGGQPALHNWAPVRTLDTKTSVSFLVGSSLCLCPSLTPGKWCCPWGDDSWTLWTWIFPSSAPRASSLFDFNLYPLDLINQDHESNFQWLLWVLLVKYWI